jgi:hypothetical protein
LFEDDADRESFLQCLNATITGDVGNETWSQRLVGTGANKRMISMDDRLNPAAGFVHDFHVSIALRTRRIVEHYSDGDEVTSSAFLYLSFFKLNLVVQ